jgi:hypothetical protein
MKTHAGRVGQRGKLVDMNDFDRDRSGAPAGHVRGGRKEPWGGVADSGAYD